MRRKLTNYWRWKVKQFPAIYYEGIFTVLLNYVVMLHINHPLKKNFSFFITMHVRPSLHICYCSLKKLIFISYFIHILTYTELNNMQRSIIIKKNYNKQGKPIELYAKEQCKPLITVKVLWIFQWNDDIEAAIKKRQMTSCSAQRNTQTCIAKTT